MASAISGGVGRDVLCLTRAHGSRTNLCGCTRDLSWGLWAAGWAAEPRPPITAVASPWDHRDPLWHEQLGFDRGRPRGIRGTLGQPRVGCPLPPPWRSGQSDAPGWAQPEVLQSFSFSSHPQYQAHRPPSTLPMFVIPALASHAAAPRQSLPVQGAGGGGPQLPLAPLYG